MEILGERYKERDDRHLKLSVDPPDKAVELFPVEISPHHAGIVGECHAEDRPRGGLEPRLLLSLEEGLDVLKGGGVDASKTRQVKSYLLDELFI